MVPSPDDVFPAMVQAMMKDAAVHKKVSFLQVTMVHPISEAPTKVRVVVLPEEKVEMTKGQIMQEIGRVMDEGDGFHYTKEGMRVVVMREQGNHTWTPDAPLGVPPIKSN